MKSFCISGMLLLTVMFLAACGDKEPKNDIDTDGVVTDTQPTDEDTVVADTVDTVADHDSATPDIVGDTDEIVTDEVVTDDILNDNDAMVDTYGFTVRIPSTHTIDCDTGSGTEATDFRDSDQICTFEYGGVSGYLYFQATPASCVYIMSGTPVFDTVGWISIGGVVTALDTPNYDWGGNHHNDFFTFAHGGVSYEYYHSSFGYGWRSCQPMDCIQILDGDGLVTEDGCTADRTLPIVCKEIKDDGSFDALVDTFEKCPGDPNPLR